MSTMNPLKLAILKMVSNERATGYDLTKTLPKVLRWSASHQQIYRDARLLESEGLLACELVYNEGKPDSKFYTITQKGIEHLEKGKVKVYKKKAHRHEASVMLAVGSISYFDTAISIADRHVKDLERQRESLIDEMDILNLDLEMDLVKAELNFAVNALKRLAPDFPIAMG